MLLEVRKLSKSFGGLVALNKLDVDVEKGTIHSIIGPNGAGKTTFFQVLTGIYSPTEGQIKYKGEDITGLPSHRIAGMGVGRTFQNKRIFKGMSVLDNMKAGMHNWTNCDLMHSILRSKRFRQEEDEIERMSIDLLEKAGLYEEKDELALNLSYGHQSKLEILRALATNPTLLLLDEPTQGMNPQESKEITDFIYHLKVEGITIILVEHDMKIVMEISDLITVIDYGEKICEGNAYKVQNDPCVIEAYLGKAGVDETT